ncbi:hypothetical protein LIER_38648 [Lithospermum erythrorhizon]|uniref:BSD domain-containing protein n=1 Tax=Lithospermum erythrorhizon TaxID=34254 RepID=A0AAV3Q5K5_LITER
MDVSSWFRRIKTSLPSIISSPQTKTNAFNEAKQEEESHKIYGITPLLLKFIHSFTLQTFKNFALPDEDDVDIDAGNIRNDLSDWQERHAILVLAKVKELSQLRFRLCPRYMEERMFWRIYFSLVRGYVSEYELRDVQLQKLKQMKSENGPSSDVSVYEVEMAEAKRPDDVDTAGSFDQT